MAHVAEHKKDKVKEFAKLIEEYPIIGVVNMQNLPTKQLQVMRENLRGKVLLRMTKRRLMNIVLNNSKKENIVQLKEHMKGMPALLFTKDNPFALFSTLKKNKSKAPISGGQTAPNDIVVPAGKTNFAPGPVIGELGGYGIMTAVEDGKIAIKANKVVAKEGDVVDAKLAGLLQRLGIEPMEIGLDLVAVYENKEILTKEVLDIDEDAIKADFECAAAMAFNLAVNSGYPTEETITVLIQKAAADSKALAQEANILTDETVGIVLAKAEGEANALNSQLDITHNSETVGAPKPEVLSEPVDEAKPAEAKEEVSETKVSDALSSEATGAPKPDKVLSDAQKPEEANNSETVVAPKDELLSVSDTPVEVKKEEEIAPETEAEEAPAEAQSSKTASAPEPKVLSEQSDKPN